MNYFKEDIANEEIRDRSYGSELFAMFFDIEHEHSFLEFRFGDFYRYVKKDSLDPQRMLFYRFHHYISLISGGLKLLHRGFPDKQLARELTKHHTECALRFIDGQ